MFLLLDRQNTAFGIVFEKPTEEYKFIEIETEEQGLKGLGKVWTGTEFINPLTQEELTQLQLKSDIEYMKCIIEINTGL